MNPFVKEKLKRVAASAQVLDNKVGRSEFELLMVKLTRDKQALSDMQGIPTKIDYKRKHFEHYWPWCEGILSQDEAREDQILINMFIWAFDIGDLDKALQLSEYMMKHDIALNKTTNFTITTAGFIARSMADLNAFPDLTVAEITPFFELVRDHDMPNQVLAEINKTLGILSKDEGNYKDAKKYFEDAKKLHEKIGVVKMINEVEKLIAEESET